jgi:hypothetical protein
MAPVLLSQGRRAGLGNVEAYARRSTREDDAVAALRRSRGEALTVRSAAVEIVEALINWGLACEAAVEEAACGARIFGRAVAVRKARRADAPTDWVGTGAQRAARTFVVADATGRAVAGFGAEAVKPGAVAVVTAFVGVVTHGAWLGPWHPRATSADLGATKGPVRALHEAPAELEGARVFAFASRVRRGPGARIGTAGNTTGGRRWDADARAAGRSAQFSARAGTSAGSSAGRTT